MSVARTWAVALTGLDGALVEVEADLTSHTPEFRIIGLPDKSLGEAVRRVTNACENSGLALPYRRITVNLSPASLPKQGSGFDLAIALAALATDGVVEPESVTRAVHIGEVGLDGRIRPVAGVLPAVAAAVAAGKARVVVPWANRQEAELVAGADVVAVASLAEAARLHGADVDVPNAAPVTEVSAGASDRHSSPDLADVIGQDAAVSAMTIAAAGGHHMLLSGPPGSGKSMIATRLPGVLPDLDDATALEVACVRSLAGTPITSLDRTPPFVAPHHSASTAALIGGGSRVIRPGAIARASGGILFIDEAAEANRATLDALRQPLESGRIDIHRAGASASFPARFQLVLATNPCPCGEFGVRGGACSCPPSTVRRYAQRLSGPLLDRIDINVRVERVTSTLVRGEGTSSRVVKRRVDLARERARRRWAGTPWRTNAEVPGSILRHHQHQPSREARAPLEAALERGLITLRGYDRVLRVARTIADLREEDQVGPLEIGEALQVRRGGVAA